MREGMLEANDKGPLSCSLQHLLITLDGPLLVLWINNKLGMTWQYWRVGEKSHGKKNFRVESSVNGEFAYNKVLQKQRKGSLMQKCVGVVARARRGE